MGIENARNQPVIFSIWLGLKQRAPGRPGDASASIDPSWGRFDTFEGYVSRLANYNSVGRRPMRGYAIDRINPARGYEPGNVRWATRAERGARRAANVQTVVELWTDGACAGNPGPGGWGFVLLAKRDGVVVKKLEASGSEPATTNNRMELRAVIEGLQRLSRPTPVSVMSDSAYVIDALRKGWAERWRQAGWTLASRTPVKNADLWRDVLSAAEPHNVAWVRVKGHAGVELNECAHRLATQAIEDRSS